MAIGIGEIGRADSPGWSILGRRNRRSTALNKIDIDSIYVIHLEIEHCLTTQRGKGCFANRGRKSGAAEELQPGGSHIEVCIARRLIAIGHRKLSRVVPEFEGCRKIVDQETDANEFHDVLLIYLHSNFCFHWTGGSSGNGFPGRLTRENYSTETASSIVKTRQDRRFVLSLSSSTFVKSVNSHYDENALCHRHQAYQSLVESEEQDSEGESHSIIARIFRGRRRQT